MEDKHIDRIGRESRGKWQNTGKRFKIKEVGKRKEMV